MSVLIGAGGHARDILATGYYMKQFTHHQDYVGYLRTHPTDYIGPVTIGINDPQVRAQIAEQLGVMDQKWVHPKAFIGPDCELGYGTHVYHFASLTRTRTGHHCQISPGATICGDVVLGDRVFVGANATIVNLTTVPDDTFIKAGTVWTGK